MATTTSSSRTASLATVLAIGSAVTLLGVWMFSKPSPDSSTKKQKKDDKQRQTEFNEYCLDETSTLLTTWSGEAGISKKIVGYVQDCLRLDSIDSINQSSCVSVVCGELQKLVDEDIADEQFVCLALHKFHGGLTGNMGQYRTEGLENFLVELGGLTGEDQYRTEELENFLVEHGLQLVARSMAVHSSNVKVLSLGFSVLAHVFRAWIVDIYSLQSIRAWIVGCICHTNYEDPNPPEELMVLSKQFTDMAAKALETFQDNELIFNELLVSSATFFLHMLYAFHNFCRCRRCRNLYPRLAHQLHLEQTKVLPICWSLLPKFITNDNIVKNVVCILTRPVGGMDRPVLKKLFAETPQAGEILAQLEAIDYRQNSQIVNIQLRILRDVHTSVRGQL